MSLRVRFVGGLLALAAIGLLSMPASSVAVGTVTCDFSNHTLAVSATDAFTRLSRDGNAIAVDDGIHPPISCTGGNANVNNTDLVTVTHSGQNSNMIDLKGGLFEPGLATEPSGLSEIEIQYLVRSYVDIRATSSTDHLGLGAGGVDLNVDGDVDVTGDFSTILLEGQGGDDVIGPIVGYAGTSGRRILNGGPGNDTIRSTPDGAVIHGGDGNDKLIGGRKADNLTGGTGEDVIKGGKGPDLIRAIDNDRDIVNCGPGFDRVKQDGIDKVKNCEKVLAVKRSKPVGGKKK